MTARELDQLRHLIDQAVRDRINGEATVNCEGCGTPFRRTNWRKLYCCHQCGARHYYRRKKQLANG